MNILLQFAHRAVSLSQRIGQGALPEYTSDLEVLKPHGIEHGLTERELGVLILLGDGLSNRAIGRELDVTEQTVKFHLTSVYQKLGAANRTGAVNRARKMGIFGNPETRGEEAQGPRILGEVIERTISSLDLATAGVDEIRRSKLRRTVEPGLLQQT